MAGVGAARAAVGIVRCQAVAGMFGQLAAGIAAAGVRARNAAAQRRAGAVVQGDLGELNRVGARPRPQSGLVVRGIEIELVGREGAQRGRRLNERSNCDVVKPGAVARLLANEVRFPTRLRTKGTEKGENECSHLCAREGFQHEAHGVVADGAAAAAVCERCLKATLRVEAFLGDSFAGEHVLRETPVLVLGRRLQ